MTNSSDDVDLLLSVVIIIDVTKHVYCTVGEMAREVSVDINTTRVISLLNCL